MQNTIQEVSKETLLLENIFSSATPGEFFSYSQLQQLTGVKMDNRGKSFMRSALNRQKMEYETVMGKGIKVLSAQNAMNIVGHRVIKIDKATKRAYKTTKRVTAKVFDELPEHEQKKLTFTGAALGTILSFAASAKRIFSKEVLKIGNKVS